MYILIEHNMRFYASFVLISFYVMAFGGVSLERFYIPAFTFTEWVVP